MANRNVKKTEIEGRRWLRKRALLVLGGLFALYLIVPMFMGEMGIISYVKIRQMRADLVREIDSLRRDNGEVRQSIERLRKDPETIEGIARERLGMARPGELIYKFESFSDAETDGQ